ncbi:MAG: exodeoxyribonuclease VII large subunit, partial [Gammaproteobacteria bacterium]|nr:exodeoxyribonuclease VII large subunit [Gammaproteobacteria bacterium]
EEGLFAEQHKKSLPHHPQCIGVITSSTGAAVYDVLKALKRRCPLLPVIIYPVLVQGTQAAGQIVLAIELANQRRECDVLIVARGGGSLEDLWSFNEEAVARAIFASNIPIVSGIGHEVDVTIADFVADHRAATPSAAAEYVSPDVNEYISRLTYLQQRLTQLILQIIQQKKQQLQWLTQRLPHPRQKLQQQAQTLDYLTANLMKAIQQQLQQQQQKLFKLTHTLEAFSPLATLNRGYAIVTKNDTVIRDATMVKQGDEITARFAKNLLTCTVKRVICQ